MRGVSPDVERILLAGNHAPSGENCQPWHLTVRNTAIEVHLLPERDTSAYNWGQRSSYLANGAAIENMVIAASAEQYRAEVKYFPNPADEWHIATIILMKDPIGKPDMLAAYTSKRISNRKPYKKDPLTDEERRALFASVEDAYGSMNLIEGRGDVVRLGRVGSTNEEVMLANRSLHQFFFSHVSWTKEEDEKKKVGFYIKTLELPPPAEMMFKLFRRWFTMRILGAIGFNRIVGKQNGSTNASAAAMGAFMIEGIEPLDFVRIGRAVERLWLTATSLGLSLQPLTGILFFRLRIVAKEGEVFSEHERNLIMNSYREASKIIKADGKHVIFMFRIGRGAAPSARAIRFPLEDVITIRS